MIRIALTNLGKYNEGELVYKWLDLPATEDEIQEAFEDIGINDEYEEHFISDYEAPFDIGEHTNIEKLNDIAEAIEQFDNMDDIFNGTYDAFDVINFAHELMNYGLVPYADEHVMDIVSDETLDEMVKHEADSGGWQRVAHFLAGITFMNDDYYRINGYGNAENLEHGHLEAIVSDLIDEMIRNV